MEIRIKEGDETFGDQKGFSDFIGGRYISLETGGPTIEYRPSIFNSYKIGLENSEAETIKKLDKSVVHELVHLWQQLRNPIGGVIETDKFVAQNLIGELYPKLGYDYLNDPGEIEARDISEKLVDSFLADKKNLEDFPWSFGKFFSFS